MQKDTKIRLVKLSLKARNTKTKEAEAFRFLENAGKVAGKEEDPLAVFSDTEVLNSSRRYHHIRP